MLSLDFVFFYVHSGLLIRRSENNFNYLLPGMRQGDSEHQPQVLLVGEHSQVLNVILHTVYGLPCGHFNPTNDMLGAAVAGLHAYGVQPNVHPALGTPLFALLAARTPRAPLFIYTLAAQFNFYDLAEHASGFLLGITPPSISEECAQRMGPVYLHRLLGLQTRRVEAMKKILRRPPSRHPPMDCCSAESQAGLARAWMLAAAYLIWEARPGKSKPRYSACVMLTFMTELTTTSMEVTFDNVATSIQCDGCKAVYRERLAQALSSWDLQKVCLAFGSAGDDSLFFCLQRTI
ncbi:uncharacterized protein PHACADRAFT_260304 [Phanerochaete carnosa HHB-10118-sp]|uniref:BTB domain-containing protein n=1 Tax=Phanerochaete carnosa (strain HHB-10118-sp) TaxID=650164 RepID=K5W3V4_PHACS|nr:uncharacterized protein PHACADRAFT_260304 [Phanerochaete carnosa HHB-10118-sp]EKM53785.1 hypothetical protein PHACADRAFT_260304 [Phanerochaete carnosa HHB-10118-sp]